MTLSLDPKERLAQLEAEHDKIVQQRRKYTARRLIRIWLLEQKCAKMNPPVIVTDAEVDAEEKRRASLKARKKN